MHTTLEGEWEAEHQDKAGLWPYMASYSMAAPHYLNLLRCIHVEHWILYIYIATDVSTLPTHIDHNNYDSTKN